MRSLLKKLSIFGLLFTVLFVSVGAQYAHAGFGITPPYVKNTSLIRNSTYEQQILLVRGEPDAEQVAEIVIASCFTCALCTISNCS